MTKLKNMIGMDNVKENIINQIIFYLQSLDDNKRCNSCINCMCGQLCQNIKVDDMMHTIITGPPGVGKTELGKILGEIYKGMGILKNGELHVATRSDLIAKYLGQTAIKTQNFIDKCSGGVMFIDEAYSLGNIEQRDSFSKECIDTINQNLTEKRDFICIIAGYADSLDDCFFKYNDGLKRRFSFKYEVTEYTPTELKDIFIRKLEQYNWRIDPDLVQSHMLDNFFAKNKEFFPNFGGDMETLFTNCKIVHGRRVLFLDKRFKRILIKSDIEKGFSLYKSHRVIDKVSSDKKDQNLIDILYI